jgi:1-acyl-sn-glycerol-3-phosphate acyltransferase
LAKPRLRYPAWLWLAIKIAVRPFAGALVRHYSHHRIAAHGLESVPKNGGLLILANHISDLDPILVQWACPRPIFFMAKRELFDMKGIGWLMRTFQAFPVKPDSPDRGALRRAIALLKAGECVCIFPEGKISPNGTLLPLNLGYEMIARQSNANIIAAIIRGAEPVMPYGTTKLIHSTSQISVSWKKVTDLETISFILSGEEPV